MKHTILAVAAVLGWAGGARAQFFAGPGLHGGFAHHRGGYGYGVSVVFAQPVYGWGPGFGNPFFPQSPVFVVPPPVIFAGGNDDPEDVSPVRNVAPPVVGKPGDFVVFRPRKDVPDQGVMTPKVDRVAPPPAPPTFRFDPFAPIDLGKVERPDPDPATESARRMKLARAAFAAEEYGKAAEHLTAASKVRPDDALPHFLKAQARFAAGQYGEAVASVRDGMKLSPDWPTAAFRPTDLYGPAPARFELHLADLRRAAAANPAEPGLAFLLGYQLWFAGDRPAARALFRAAAPRVRDAAVIDRFLNVPEKP